MNETRSSSRRGFLRDGTAVVAGLAVASGLNLAKTAHAAAGDERATAVDKNAKPVELLTEPDGTARGRLIPQLRMPFVDCEGTASECGEILGSIWKAALAREAERTKSGAPWWKSPRCKPLVEKYCPHLPDVYCGMAKGANVNENALGEPRQGEAPVVSCTSFAVAPDATLEGIPISGQTKDVGVARAREMLVLRMKMTNAPSLLTLTYTGSTWLFGHGFVSGGTAIFRNSLYVAQGAAGLPYPVWGLIALHCRCVEDVIEITNRYGIEGAGHVVVSDQRGGIVGIEFGKDGVAYLRPKEGIYVHANAVLTEGPLRETEKDAGLFRREESLHRTHRLTERLRTERGHLTAPLAYGTLCDHDGYPTSVCRHQSKRVSTGAAVIAEPTRGLLHVTHGPPCRHWPHTYSIASIEERITSP